MVSCSSHRRLTIVIVVVAARGLWSCMGGWRSWKPGRKWDPSPSSLSRTPSTQSCLCWWLAACWFQATLGNERRAGISPLSCFHIYCHSIHSMRAKSLCPKRIYQVLTYEYINLTCWHLKLVHSWRLWILFYPTSFLVNCYPQTSGGKWISSV